MWCDNCLLVFPLRSGGMAWGMMIFLYSVGGGIFLLLRGQFLFFNFPEWQIYGVISIGTGVVAALSILAFSNVSYAWAKTASILWPFCITVSAIRGIIIAVELQNNGDKIAWECANGGQVWSAQAAAESDGATIPPGFCTAGLRSLSMAFLIALLLDIGFQVYMCFMTWRFSQRWKHYSSSSNYTIA